MLPLVWQHHMHPAAKARNPGDPGSDGRLVVPESRCRIGPTKSVRRCRSSWRVGGPRRRRGSPVARWSSHDGTSAAGRNQGDIVTATTYVQRAFIPIFLLLCALCEVGCLPPATQRQTAPTGAGAPRITSAQASDEFPHLPAGKVQIAVYGDGFSPSTKALLTVGSIRIPVVTDHQGQLSSVTIGSLVCDRETMASAKDANGSQSNSFAFLVYCRR